MFLLLIEFIYLNYIHKIINHILITKETFINTLFCRKTTFQAKSLHRKAKVKSFSQSNLTS